VGIVVFRPRRLTPNPHVDNWSAHSATTPYVTGGISYDSGVATPGLAYIGSHLIYIVVFVLFTLGLFYLVGKKSTTYFLVLVLLGQLIIPGGTGSGVQQLMSNFKVFGGG